MTVNRSIRIISAMFGSYIIYTLLNRLCLHWIAVMCAPELIREAEYHANHSAD